MKMRVMLGMPGTCWASTCRSGSDRVTMTPTRNAISKMSHSFLLRVMAEPTSSPMGVMARSVPRVKSPIPMISMAAPVRKPSMALEGAGTKRKHKTVTIRTMGSTEDMASVHFSFSAP